MTKMGITIYECDQGEATLFHKLSSRFDIVPTITHAAISKDTIELTSGNRCISISHKTRVSHETLRMLAQAGVEYISTRSAGYNHIDVDFAKGVGITVGNVAYSPDSVADYTLMLMLMAIRDVRSIIDRASDHDFRLDGLRGKELRDLTVGVIGTGRIGAAVIDRLQGFDCRIVAYDHRPKASADYVPLDELLTQSDIVTLHTPLNTDTYHLLSGQRIEQLKPGAFIINTGRGPLLDTKALAAALKAGKLGGAALDVIEGEEGIFYADHRNKLIENQSLLELQNLPNVIVTPHAAYYTEHALSDIVKNTIVNCLEFEDNKAHIPQKEE